MKKKVIRPVVGEFVGGEPHAIRYLQTALNNAGDRELTSATYTDDRENVTVSIARMDTKGVVYGVSINGKRPSLLEVIEV